MAEGQLRERRSREIQEVNWLSLQGLAFISLSEGPETQGRDFLAGGSSRMMDD
ncbi:hypothetical protein NQZ68_027305 [Dissostichus eleginoides]|nr:hypothetical protein NQZ68_027305 [Dissostichus eleginoides]